MTRREDGSVIMPPMTRLQQCYLFQGFVSGYAHATGEAVELWSMVGGDVLYAYDAKSGTRSPSLDRSQHLDSEIFERTVADLLDDRSKWTPSGAPQILGADQPLFCDPGTYEGECAKPTAPHMHGEMMNKWCARECERSRIVANLDDLALPDFSQRVYNIARSTGASAVVGPTGGAR